MNNYDKYISKTAIYCNDRSTYNNSYTTTGAFNYASYTRIEEDKIPTYKCGGNGTGGLFESTQAVADKFSASTSGGGNGQLKYPIALMTADEISFAGGVYSTPNNKLVWYYTNSKNEAIVSYPWWTMSPYVIDYQIILYPLTVFAGKLGGDWAEYSYAVRPVISISKCAKVKSGNGTPESPYEIDENSCS